VCVGVGFSFVASRVELCENSKTKRQVWSHFVLNRASFPMFLPRPTKIRCEKRRRRRKENEEHGER